MDNKDLKFIKKHYGENFAKLCRELFPTLLEQEGLLSEIISLKFAPSRCLYDSIILQKAVDEFKAYIYSFIDVEKDVKEIVQTKTPEELFDDAGYILYPECKTEEEVQSYKKFYSPGEMLCTFNGGRLNNYRVWFAVKKNVDEIKRENFTNPTRQDEYGTSVISIQFSKGKSSTLSIKNRYNHAVNHCDSTFSNNLDNIIEGLHQAFIDTYNIQMVNGKSNFGLDDFVLATNGKMYKSILERENIHVCENNYIVQNGEVVDKYAKNKARYLFIDDQYVFDLEEKKIINIFYQFTRFGWARDSFLDSFGEIEDIFLTHEVDEEGLRELIITPKESEKIVLKINEEKQIVELTNKNVTEIDDGFLERNHVIRKIDLPNVENIGKNFLFNNEKLSSISFQKLLEIGDNFLSGNQILEDISVPSLKIIGSSFLRHNKKLKSIDLPNVKVIVQDFLSNNEILEKINISNAKEISTGFLSANMCLTSLYLPNAEEIKSQFLIKNEILEYFYAPKLERIGMYFMKSNKTIKELNLPNVKYIDYDFMCYNNSLKRLYLPKVNYIEKEFLLYNTTLEQLYCPNLRYCGDEKNGERFLSNNKKFERVTSSVIAELSRVGEEEQS